MTANIGMKRVNELHWLRGFTNLFRKENRMWWGTRRWWINALLWSGMFGGLVFMLLFMLPTVPATQNTEEVIAVGGPIEYAVQLGITVFFRMGSIALALGVIVLSQDLILDELQSGVTEWLLSMPVTRRAYLLAKLAASSLAVLVLMLVLPALFIYLLLYLRIGAPYSGIHFLQGMGILTLHTFFYLTFTIMLGTFFRSRTLILGLAIASVMGGTFIGGIVKPLLYVTPWILVNTAELVVMGETLPPEMVTYPALATAVWCLVFMITGIKKFERIEL